MSLNVLVLESVGSCMDEDGTVYPMNTDNTPDTNSGVDWLDTTDEWSESLSEEDAGLLNDWLLENNYSVDVDDYDYGRDNPFSNDPDGDDWDAFPGPDDGSWIGR